MLSVLLFHSDQFSISHLLLKEGTVLSDLQSGSEQFWAQEGTMLNDRQSGSDKFLLQPLYL